MGKLSLARRFVLGRFVQSWKAKDSRREPTTSRKPEAEPARHSLEVAENALLETQLDRALASIDARQDPLAAILRARVFMRLGQAEAAAWEIGRLDLSLLSTGDRWPGTPDTRSRISASR